MLNGEVKVRLAVYGVFARAYLEDTIRAVLNWNPCLRGLSGW